MRMYPSIESNSREVNKKLGDEKNLQGSKELTSSDQRNTTEIDTKSYPNKQTNTKITITVENDSLNASNVLYNNQSAYKPQLLAPIMSSLNPVLDTNLIIGDADKGMMQDGINADGDTDKDMWHDDNERCKSIFEHLKNISGYKGSFNTAVGKPSDMCCFDLKSLSKIYTKDPLQAITGDDTDLPTIKPHQFVPKLKNFKSNSFGNYLNQESDHRDSLAEKNNILSVSEDDKYSNLNIPDMNDSLNMEQFGSALGNETNKFENTDIENQNIGENSPLKTMNQKNCSNDTLNKNTNKGFQTTSQNDDLEDILSESLKNVSCEADTNDKSIQLQSVAYKNKSKSQVLSQISTGQVGKVGANKENTIVTIETSMRYQTINAVAEIEQHTTEVNIESDSEDVTTSISVFNTNMVLQNNKEAEEFTTFPDEESFTTTKHFKSRKHKYKHPVNTPIEEKPVSISSVNHKNVKLHKHKHLKNTINPEQLMYCSCLMERVSQSLKEHHETTAAIDDADLSGTELEDINVTIDHSTEASQNKIKIVVPSNEMQTYSQQANAAAAFQNNKEALSITNSLSSNQSSNVMNNNIKNNKTSAVHNDANQPSRDQNIIKIPSTTDLPDTICETKIIQLCNHVTSAVGTNIQLKSNVEANGPVILQSEDLDKSSNLFYANKDQQQAQVIPNTQEQNSPATIVLQNYIPSDNNSIQYVENNVATSVKPSNYQSVQYVVTTPITAVSNIFNRVPYDQNIIQNPVINRYAENIIQETQQIGKYPQEVANIQNNQVLYEQPEFVGNSNQGFQPNLSQQPFLGASIANNDELNETSLYHDALEYNIDNGVLNVYANTPILNQEVFATRRGVYDSGKKKDKIHNLKQIGGGSQLIIRGNEKLKNRGNTTSVSNQTNNTKKYQYLNKSISPGSNRTVIEAQVNKYAKHHSINNDNISSNVQKNHSNQLSSVGGNVINHNKQTSHSNKYDGAGHKISSNGQINKKFNHIVNSSSNTNNVVPSSQHLSQPSPIKPHLVSKVSNKQQANERHKLGNNSLHKVGKNDHLLVSNSNISVNANNVQNNQKVSQPSKGIVSINNNKVQNKLNLNQSKGANTNNKIVNVNNLKKISDFHNNVHQAPHQHHQALINNKNRIESTKNLKHPTELSHFHAHKNLSNIQHFKNHPRSMGTKTYVRKHRRRRKKHHRFK